MDTVWKWNERRGLWTHRADSGICHDCEVAPDGRWAASIPSENRMAHPFEPAPGIEAGKAAALAALARMVAALEARMAGADAPPAACG